MSRDSTSKGTVTIDKEIPSAGQYHDATSTDCGNLIDDLGCNTHSPQNRVCPRQIREAMEKCQEQHTINPLRQEVDKSPSLSRPLAGRKGDTLVMAVRVEGFKIPLASQLVYLPPMEVCLFGSRRQTVVASSPSGASRSYITPTSLTSSATSSAGSDGGLLSSIGAIFCDLG